MKDQRQFAVFLKSLTPLAWACLLMALASFAVSIYAWLPIGSHSAAILVPMHLATMAILFGVFAVMAKHHLAALHMRNSPRIKVSLPAGYWLATFASLAYLLAVFIGGALYYPPGVDLGPAVNLRIFASGWLFLSLAGLGFAQWAGLRLRAYRAAA